METEDRFLKSGFTLLEFLLVILLLGIVTFFVALYWPERSINVYAQAALLADDIRYTQSLSMTRGERCRFIVNSATSYRLTDGSGATHTLPLRNNPVTLGTGISFATPVGSLVVFDSRGMPYQDAVLPGTPLAEPKTFTLIGGGQSSTIYVYPETGRVTIQ